MQVSHASAAKIDQKTLLTIHTLPLSAAAHALSRPCWCVPDAAHLATGLTSPLLTLRRSCLCRLWAAFASAWQYVGANSSGPAGLAFPAAGCSPCWRTPARDHGRPVAQPERRAAGFLGPTPLQQRAGSAAGLQHPPAAAALCGPPRRNCWHCVLHYCSPPAFWPYRCRQQRSWSTAPTHHYGSGRPVCTAQTCQGSSVSRAAACCHSAGREGPAGSPRRGRPASTVGAAVHGILGGLLPPRPPGQGCSHAALHRRTAPAAASRGAWADTPPGARSCGGCTAGSGAPAGKCGTSFGACCSGLSASAGASCSHTHRQLRAPSRCP